MTIRKWVRNEKIEFPVLNVKMVDINKVVANDYNPNKVAPPEMELLKHSIEEDGYTQPIVTIDKDLENSMASTIRHNRARGTHQIVDMSHIVLTLTENGWTEEQISKHLGMELDEIIRLKQITGLKESFANHTFSKSWEEFEIKLKNKL